MATHSFSWNPQSLIDQAPIGISIATLDGRLLYANTALAQLLEYDSPADLLREPLSSWYAHHAERAALLDQLRDNGTLQDQEITLRTRTGAERVVIASISLDGSTFTAMMVDISARKQAQMENLHLFGQIETERAQLARRVAERTADLSLANAELARAIRLKDEFLANMSHELRTPLNSILGRTEAIQEGIYGPASPKQVEVLQGITESGQHLLTLINDILDLSKIEAGRLELVRTLIDVSQLCSMCIRMIGQIAVARRISIATSLDGMVQLINADERRLKQILVNLLVNAIQFTPEGGKVGLDVCGDMDQQRVTFTVWDTGAGIAADDLPKLFQPFVQIDTSLIRQHTGSGLGLALVLRLAKAHGGSVLVESTPGQGSRFSVTLPWDSARQRPEHKPPPPEIAMPQPFRQVLVVEDSPTSAEQLTRYLRDVGADVAIHPQGSGSLEHVLKLQPDLIILDILLPDRNGWEVLSQLKADPRTQAIPVIVVSVVDEPGQANTFGAAALLRKPIDRATLIQVLHRLAPDPSMAPVRLAMAGTPHERRPRVMIAEDSQTNIDIFYDYLDAKGYTVSVARNGSEALLRAQEDRPDAILMDIQMPGMDGIEAIKRLRADPDQRAVPIIAVSALTMPSDRERCLQAGANEYLSKPINLRTLVALIETLRQRKG